MGEAQRLHLRDVLINGLFKARFHMEQACKALAAMEELVKWELERKEKGDEGPGQV